MFAIEGYKGFKVIVRDLGCEYIVGGYGRGSGIEIEAEVGVKSGN